MYILFCSCAIFLAVVLIFCMILTYDYAVVPFFVHIFLQLYIYFCSCRPIFIDFRTTLKHKHTAFLVISKPLW